MEKILSIHNLSGGYQNELIVRNISLDVSKGDLLSIIGPNGSGKTTLFRLISRIIKPVQGNIALSGKDILRLPLKDFSCQVAFVSQDSIINFSFTVWEIVLMGRIPHLKRLQAEGAKDFSIAEKSLSLTDTLHLRNKMINELSSGERQRVLIARALAQEPELLFLDEPTSHLDIGHQIQILDLLRKLNLQDKLTIVMVLHDLNLASEYSNRIVLFNQGKIFKQGSPKEVLTYQNIEAVYKTVVVVEDNPINKKPYVVLVSGR
ncbi:MAG: ABC transporter ATP-binding protein [Candidatus Omnitrophota bacterium]|nr:ABC transporter ATP-binding protein [Candidatus Omnitrophota bacterium]